MGKLKTRTWILLIAALAAVFALLTRYTLARQAPGRKAEVVQDGKVLYTIDLDRVTQPYTFTVEDPEGGCNVVSVKPGSICVETADCPDKICVHTGRVTLPDQPVVCLPHRVTARIIQE